MFIGGSGHSPLKVTIGVRIPVGAQENRREAFFV
jgi:hypothetical protein